MIVARTPIIPGRVVLHLPAMAANDRPYPASKLIDYLACGSADMAGELLGLSGSAVCRWLHSDKHLTETEADRLACRIRCHPAEIWSNWWTEADALA